MTGHVFIYGSIGSGTGEVSINSVRSQLDPQAESYVVHIVSPGGDVFEGYGIYNILKNTGKKVVTQVEGLCASIATLVAFAGEEIVMNKTAEFMIHNPHITDLRGESSDLRNVADQLDKIKNLLIDVSAARVARNGKAIDKNKLWELYDNETWLTAHEAETFGFVDRVEDAIKAVARVNIENLKSEMENSKQKSILARVAKFLNFISPTNEFKETLADGRVIVVMAEGDDWTGAQVMLEDGTPVPAGTHELASGKSIVTDESGVITQVMEAPAPEQPQEEAQNEDMENKIKELESQLAAAKAEAQAKVEEAQKATAEAVQANTNASKYQNKLTIVEKELIAIKEELQKTVGEEPIVDKGPAFKNVGKEQNFDPMAELGQAFITSRPSNTFKK